MWVLGRVFDCVIVMVCNLARQTHHARFDIKMCQVDRLWFVSVPVRPDCQCASELLMCDQIVNVLYDQIVNVRAGC